MIYNMTRHPSTQEQKDMGIIDPPKYIYGRLKDLGTFDELPSPAVVLSSATAAAHLIFEYLEEDAEAEVLLSGAPYFTMALAQKLKAMGIKTSFPYFKRVFHLDGVYFTYQGSVSI